MKPNASLVDQLLAYGESNQQYHRDRIYEFSCGHVIDGATQLLPAVLSHGPSGQKFDFTYSNRNDTKLIDDLGRTVINFCNIIPGGVVCFFPSYQYENLIYERWKSTGVIARIQAKKKVYLEPKQSSEVDKILSDYTQCIKKCEKSAAGQLNGALLLSVVGGKMSEGINFSDDLGRCVIMVGLPYPNMYSPELKEKMAYLNKNMPSHDGKTAGQCHYENLCMKAVNQSIGRAIRHKNDYSSILMLDERYSRDNIRKKIPSWISDHIKVHDRFGPCFASVKKFFDSKKKS